MNNYLKIRNENIIMKLFTIFFMSIFLASTAFGAVISAGQTANIENFIDNGNGNQLLETVVGSVNDVIFGINETYDVRYEFPIFNDDLFVIVETVAPMNTNWIVTTDGVSISQQINLTETGEYFFKLSPTETGESVLLFVDLLNNSDIAFFSLVESQPAGFGTLMSTFITGVSNLIDTVDAFWTLLFYVFIFLVIIAGIALFVGLGFKIVEWAERFKEKKNKHLVGRNREERGR